MLAMELTEVEPAWQWHVPASLCPEFKVSSVSVPLRNVVQREGENLLRRFGIFERRIVSTWVIYYWHNHRMSDAIVSLKGLFIREKGKTDPPRWNVSCLLVFSV